MSSHIPASMTGMQGMVVPVILGSVRTGRLGIRVARYVVSRLSERGAEPVLVDPCVYQLPLIDKMYKEFAKGTAPKGLDELAALYRRSDGYVIVSAEYNQAIPPALSNLLDYFLEEYYWRPAGIACYSNGRFGGVRAAVSLRTMLGELGMVTLPSYISFPKVQDLLTGDGVPTDPSTDKYDKVFFDELAWYMSALRAQRATGVPY